MLIGQCSSPAEASTVVPFTGQEFAELYEARKAREQFLGDLSLIVLIARKREEAPNLRPEWPVSNDEVNSQDEELAKMSTNGRFIYAENSTLNIPRDEPQVVIDAIRKVMLETSRNPNQR